MSEMIVEAVEEGRRVPLNEHGVAFPCPNHPDREGFVTVPGRPVTFPCRECWLGGRR